MKAFQCNKIAYKSKDLAILCNNSTDVVEIELERKKKPVYGVISYHVNYDSKTIVIDSGVDELYNSMFNGVEFSFEPVLSKDNDGFLIGTQDLEPKFNAKFQITDLSDKLQTELLEEIRKYLPDYYAEWEEGQLDMMNEYYPEDEY